MHPVIEHILARQGKRVPVNDGRKIALVLYGGGMSGVAGAGAMIALQDLGLTHTFDAIYTYSAGFANASYLLGDATRLGTSIYYEDLIGRRFINLWRFWRIMNVQYLVHVMEKIKPLPVTKIIESSTELFIRLWNVNTGRTEYVEAHDFSPEQYLRLMAAATSLRHVGIGPTKLGSNNYEDYPFSKDVPEHLYYVLDTDATDIFVIYNRPNQRVNSIKMSERLYEIIPDLWVRNTYTNPDKLKRAAESMASQIYQLFGDQRRPSL
jgi:predicted patatin/cPLA2 family phospholipase